MAWMSGQANPRSRTVNCLLRRKNKFSKTVLIMFSLLKLKFHRQYLYHLQFMFKVLLKFPLLFKFLLLLLMFHLQYQYQLECLLEGLQECLEAEAVVSRAVEVEDTQAEEEMGFQEVEVETSQEEDRQGYQEEYHLDYLPEHLVRLMEVVSLLLLPRLGTTTLARTRGLSLP